MICTPEGEEWVNLSLLHNWQRYAGMPASSYAGAEPPRQTVEVKVTLSSAFTAQPGGKNSS